MSKATIYSPERNLTMDDRELNTVLAALRLWQTQREQDLPLDLLSIASNGGTQEPRLSGEEIDALCDRLNGAQ